MDCFYTATIDGIKLELTQHKRTCDSYGGKTLLARHFLGKEEWQNLVKENFGNDIFDEIYEALNLQYIIYKENL